MSEQATITALPPPPAPRGWTPARIGGYLLVGIWIALAAGLLLFLVRSWNPDLFARYAPAYWSGLKTTLTLVGLSVALGAILSVPLALARSSRRRLLAWPAYLYVYFFRGTPLIVQSFLIYYGLGQFRPQLEAIGLWGFFRDAWNCALLAFTLNTAAYQAEILRGAVQAVARGQWEGAASLGLSRFQTFRMIVFPQAMIVALRAYGNEIVLMIKGSAVVAIITVYDLMGETRRAFSRTFDFQTYIWAAILYLSIVETLRHVIDLIERRLTRHLKR